MESKKGIKGDQGAMARFVWLNHRSLTCKKGTSLFMGLILERNLSNCFPFDMFIRTIFLIFFVPLKNLSLALVLRAAVN